MLFICYDTSNVVMFFNAKKKYSSFKIFWSEMFQGHFVIKGLHQKEVFIKNEPSMPSFTSMQLGVPTLVFN